MACRHAVVLGHAVAGRASMSLRVAGQCRRATFQSGSVRAVGDADAMALASEVRPVVLHCGVEWSARSRAVAARLEEWARSDGESAGVLCVQADLGNTPRLVEERHIRGVPTVLLLRGGRTERRADSADIPALERVLNAASAYCLDAVTAADAEPRDALAAAEELVRRGVPDPVDAAALYSRALTGGGPPLAFRARLGLLKCALMSAGNTPLPPAEVITKAAAALAELRTHHQEELVPRSCSGGVGADALAVSMLVAHAELLVDAWECGVLADDRSEVLRLYAEGHKDAAVDAALAWYQREAAGDIEGLVAAYCSSERRISDREGDVPLTSVYALEAFASEPAAAFIAPRALLRRLFAALGPTHELVNRARAELEFLLDRRKWVPFHTRHILLRLGGKPKAGRGTGSGSGYSKMYWVAWSPDRMYKNQKPMGGPHTDKGD